MQDKGSFRNERCKTFLSQAPHEELHERYTQSLGLLAKETTVASLRPVPGRQQGRKPACGSTWNTSMPNPEPPVHLPLRPSSIEGICSSLALLQRTGARGPFPYMCPHLLRRAAGGELVSSDCRVPLVLLVWYMGSSLCRSERFLHRAPKNYPGNVKSFVCGLRRHQYCSTAVV